MTIETANRLYELRKQQGLSQEELAERLGVSRQAVSKWERSEASPDTDNLIALAKIYGLSLDELIYGKKVEQSSADTQADGETEGDADDEKKGKNGAKTNINISPCGIYVDDEDGDKIQINLKGIRIETASSGDPDDKDENEEIKIDLNGIHIKSKSEDDDDDEDEGDIVIVDADGKNTIKITKEKNKKKRFWLEIPYAIICAVAYLIFGFTNSFGGWGAAWIIFVTIPIYYSLVEAIFNKRFCDFSYAVLAAFLYLYLGMYHGNWHPSWLIFLTIPIYYPIAAAIDKKIKASDKKKSE